MRRRTLRALIAVSAASATCATIPAAGLAAPPAVGSNALLPDLDQQTPTSLQVAQSNLFGKPRYALGFQSAVRNIGEGPLIIDGRRGNTRNPLMTAEQLVRRRDGSQMVAPAIGKLRYAVAIGHQHWHYLGFDRYELRRAGGDQALVRDHKSGFCLGDRYRVADVALAAAPPVASYTRNCGLWKPRRLHVTEGISVGYGDNYQPYLEGQSLPLTGLRAGRYVLVHRVNGNQRVLESNYNNNAASVLLDLRWHNGVPVVRTLATCPDSGRCGVQDARRPAAVRVVRVTWRALVCPLHERAGAADVPQSLT